MNAVLLRSSICALLLASVGCGKKGPPLPPFVRIPEAVEKISAKRSGNDVYVTLTVPTRNVDQTIPVSITRVDVFGYTGRTAPPRSRWVEFGSLVASIPIQAPTPAGLPPSSVAEPAAAPQAAPDDAAYATPGSSVTIRDTLSGDDLVQGPTIVLPPLPDGKPAPQLPSSTLPLRRFYIAVGVGPRERPSVPGTPAELVLTPLPDAPSGLTAAYTASALSLSWEPSGGILGYLLERPLGPEDPPFGEFDEERPAATARGAELPPGPTLYNIYREIEPDPLAPLLATGQSIWTRPPVAPVNSSPVTGLTFDDSPFLNRRRCYVVRAVRGSGSAVVESEPSEPLCVTPVDVFPPAPPNSLVAVAAAGAISLIWEPSEEPDAAGYVVLRGEAPATTLQPLTASPIAEARYRDNTVKSGVRYVYAVVAIDSRLPLPNVSAESARVEETAP